MIRGHSVLAVIPARGGSKTVPRKNLRTLVDMPLIGWTIRAAKASQYLDRLIVSTEDHEIAEVAQQLDAEVPFTRPRHLSRDDVPHMGPILHALEMIPGYDYVVMLQATSPLRLPQDIDGCIETCVLGRHRACVSVAESERNPEWMYSLDERGMMKPVLGREKTDVVRQALPKTYALNGAVYVAEVGWLKKANRFVTTDTIGYLMPRERSIDIDTELDFELCEFLLKKQQSRSACSDRRVNVSHVSHVPYEGH